MHSLGTRLALLIAAILFGSMSLVALWVDQQQTGAMHHEEVEEAEVFASTLLEGLQSVLLTGGGDAARQWQKNLHNGPWIEHVEVYRRDGTLAFHDLATVDKVNRKLGTDRFQREPLAPKHDPKAPLESVRKAAASSEQHIISKYPGYLNLFLPIRSQPQCVACHGVASDSVLGVLHVRLSTKTAEARISGMRHALWSTGTLVTILLAVALWIALRKIVLTPVESLRLALQRSAAGDRSFRLNMNRRDEIGAVASGFDAMQEELQAREGHLQAIVDNAPSAIISTDAQGIIQSFNPAAEQIFGYRGDEVLGRNISMLVPEPHQSRHDGYIRHYLDTGEAHIIGMGGRELAGLRKDGGTFPIQLLISEMRLGSEVRFLGMIQDITERKRRETEIAHLATHDALTQLVNRNLLVDRIAKAIGAKTPFSLYMMGLDRFKAVNEVLGHAAGDKVLIEVANRLSALANGEALPARIGGDIFVVFWPGVNDPERCFEVVQKLQSALEKPLKLDSYSVDVEASIGITVFPDHTENPEEFLRRAEVAMEAAKRIHSGYAFYDEELEQFRIEHLTLAGELGHAIKAGELVLYYQPKIDIRSETVCGVEALVRWFHPEKGLMPPDLFIPMAEETGLIHPFTSWVLDEAMRQASCWQAKGIDLIMSVNIAARNLMDAQIVSNIRQGLERWDIPPDLLMLEITESGLMADPVTANRVLGELHDLGIGLSIDDFGTGYSSLAYLKDLPVDELKIDQVFVCDMHAHDKNSKIVRATIQLAHNLGLAVTAEGVEHKDVLERLASFGCDRAQGYFLGYPMPPDELELWLADSRWAGQEKRCRAREEI